VLEVAVREADEPPGERENEPAEREGKDEVEQVPAPLYVDERRKDVGHVALAAFLDVGASHIAFAVLEDQSLVRSLNFVDARSSRRPAHDHRRRGRNVVVRVVD